MFLLDFCFLTVLIIHVGAEESASNQVTPEIERGEGTEYRKKALIVSLGGAADLPSP